jgi:transcription elongation factor Elf1
MPSTITAFIPMTFVCKWHPDCELEVFQPANNSAYVGKCYKCVQENDRQLNELTAKVDEQIKFVDKTIKAEEAKIKTKKKPSLYLNGRKINFVTKKGGKK